MVPVFEVGVSWVVTACSVVVGDQYVGCPNYLPLQDEVKLSEAFER